MAYEAERRPATTDLVLLNRGNGPEQVMQMVEERAPNGFKVVTEVLTQAGARRRRRQLQARRRLPGRQAQRQAADRAAAAGRLIRAQPVARAGRRINHPPSLV